MEHTACFALWVAFAPDSGGDDDPYTLSFRGLDNSTYYMTQEGNGAHLLNYSGCGNTVNANHPVTKQLILDSLRRSGRHHS